jgi:GABA(A) receptor-associated protein
VQVIYEKDADSDYPTVNRIKFLIPSDLTVGQLVYVIRNRIKLDPDKVIYIFMGGVLPSPSALMDSIYEEHKDRDGFLYMT